MNLNDALKGMQNPQSFQQQVESSAYYILYTQIDDKAGPAYFEALGSIPERAKAAAIQCFIAGDATSYHAKVLRAALKHFNKYSYLDESVPVKTVSELTA
jgi:hypothetical protein